MKWLINLFKKKQPEPIKNQQELSQRLDKVLNYQSEKNEENLSLVEQKLKTLEETLKEIILKKREIQENYEKSLTEIKRNIVESTKLENKTILLYDYYLREVKIFKLQEKLKSMNYMSSGREKVSEEVHRLMCINVRLENGTLQRNIDPQIIIELRKKLGIYESNY